ncbi:hypothetical protein [Haladaptatus sp. CMAA 1911]|uniref:hypothetical protein n=1 Tax=unclassified Haladaptatus TaxID=2622732 RepID=UPI0037543E0A
MVFGGFQRLPVRGSSDGGNVRLLFDARTARRFVRLSSITRLFPAPFVDRGSHSIRIPT